MPKSKGFTLIELLVVVAIIAVLASVVLGSVMGYQNKGKNAAIKASSDTIMTNAIAWFEGHGSYLNFDIDATFTGPSLAVANSGGSPTSYHCNYSNGCTSATNVFCFCAQLNVAADTPIGSTWCVDTTGYKKATTGVCNNTNSSRCNSWTGLCSD